jgi:beta-lactamase class A
VKTSSRRGERAKLAKLVNLIMGRDSITEIVSNSEDSMRRQAFLLTALLMCFVATVSAADINVLREQIQKVIPRARGQVGVAIKHAESGAELLIDADEKYPMASAYKLPILVELYYQRAAGKLSLDDRIEIQPADLHVGSGVMSQLFDPPGVQLSFHNLINLMMRISDNSAADVLLTKAGPANVTQRMRTLGLETIRVDRTTQEMILDQSGVDYAAYGRLPIAQLRERLVAVDAASAARANDQFNGTEKDIATPRQMNALLEKIYRGQIVDRQTSDEIIEILKRCQTGPGRIRGLLPEDTVVAHKTGTIGGSTNDTGIVFLPRGDHLFITILMRDGKAPAAERERVIADIARSAYDYFVFNPAGR